MRNLLGKLPIALLVASCSSPPQPPSADESTRRPANSPLAVELQTCQSMLHNERIQASETTKLLELRAVALARSEAAQRAAQTTARTAALDAAGNRAGNSTGNSVFTVHFDFGATQTILSNELGNAMLASARSAPFIFVRGRTDGSVDSVVESRIARERAASIRDYLVAAGVPPAKIRTTYQPSGDAIADNNTEGGRRANRRVEVEIYRTVPVQVDGVVSQ